MTLIAFATNGDTATIMTDSLAYSAGGRSMGHSTKLLPLPHIDAALATQGNSMFGEFAKVAALGFALEAPDADALADALAAELPHAWEATTKNKGGGTEGTVYLIGWSPSRGAFTAWMLAAEHGFQAEVVDGPHIVPCPLNYRPSDLEANRLLDEGRLDQEEVDAWREQPPIPTPGNLDEWAELLFYARQTRALMQEAKVFIGGSLYGTLLARGEQSTCKLAEFDDSGEEFRQMVAGTLHPLGLAGDCPCGSGERFRECCLAGHLDEPCECGSTKALRDCCAAEEVPATA